MISSLSQRSDINSLPPLSGRIKPQLERSELPPCPPLERITDASVVHFTESLEAFVTLFISRMVSYRCGQLNETEFLDFAPAWLNGAHDRLRAAEHRLPQCEQRLEEAVYHRFERGVSRLRCAIEDADRELLCADHRGRSKSISFSKPIAYRVVHPSCSPHRISLRSVATEPDADEGQCHQRRRVVFPDDIDNCAAAEGEEEHFSGRTSGIYYGDILAHTRNSGSRDSRDARDSLNRASGGSGNACRYSKDTAGRVDSAGLQECLIKSRKPLRRDVKRWRLYWSALTLLLLLGILAAVVLRWTMYYI